MFKRTTNQDWIVSPVSGLLLCLDGGILTICNFLRILPEYLSAMQDPQRPPIQPFLNAWKVFQENERTNCQLFFQSLLHKRWVKRLNPHRSFKTRLGLAIATTILLFSLLLSWIVGNTSKAQIKAGSRHFMEQLAYQMSRNLDRHMFVYYQEIQTLATLEAIRDSQQPLTSKRALLNQLQTAYKNYAWIGLTNSDGVVVASTNQILEGKNVSKRPWFIQGQQGPTVEDVHDAKLLAPLLPNPDPSREPLRFVDIAAPIHDTTDANQFTGVLGAHLYWNWAKGVRDDLLKPLQNRYHVEAMILSQSGEVLLAPTVAPGSNPIPSNPNWFSSLPDLKSIQTAQQGKRGSFVEQWQDGTYLTGFAATQGHENYPGLGWIVLVRQSTQEAFATAITLQKQIIIWGIGLGLASGALAWWIAGQFLNPILAIALIADRIRRGDTSIHIPVFSGKDEVAKLSQAISSLLANLEQQKQLLQTFNMELEQKVEKRTLALQQANQELQRLTMVDGLTGVANRRHFDQHLAREWRRAVREQSPLSLILIDIDYFKRYNDYYGHPAGDTCLQQVAQTLHRQIHRSHDLAARYGGEEFVVILPNTGIEGAVHLAETIRQAVKDLQLPHAESLISQFISLSLGVATTVPTVDFSPSILIEYADKQLYQAKIAGRNRVIFGTCREG